jgi:hypothetical protein
MFRVKKGYLHIEIRFMLRSTSREKVDPAVTYSLAFFLRLGSGTFIWCLEHDTGIATLASIFVDSELDSICLTDFEAFEELENVSFFGTPGKSSHSESALGIRV